MFDRNVRSTRKIKPIGETMGGVSGPSNLRGDKAGTTTLHSSVAYTMWFEICLGTKEKSFPRRQGVRSSLVVRLHANVHMEAALRLSLVSGCLGVHEVLSKLCFKRQVGCILYGATKSETHSPLTHLRVGAMIVASMAYNERKTDAIKLPLKSDQVCSLYVRTCRRHENVPYSHPPDM